MLSQGKTMGKVSVFIQSNARIVITFVTKNLLCNHAILF